MLLVDKFEYRFHAPNEGDIVVFPPPVPTPDDFIKRVIGRPGDRLRVAGGTVYLNDVRAESSTTLRSTRTTTLQIRDYGIYVSYGDGWQRLDPKSANVPPASQWTAPDRIPPHCYIMLGDNRNDSEDSHIWGFAQDGGRFATGPARRRTRRIHRTRVSHLLAAFTSQDSLRRAAKYRRRGPLLAMAIGSEPGPAAGRTRTAPAQPSSSDFRRSPDFRWNPHIRSGEYVLINTFAYRIGAPHRDEIVAFRHEGGAREVFIKRVVGLPGDRIRIDRGRVYVDGRVLDEPYVRYADDRSFPEVTVPAGLGLRAGRQPRQQRGLASLRPGIRRSPDRPRRRRPLAAAYAGRLVSRH